MFTENYAGGPSASLLSALRARIDAVDQMDEASVVAELMKQAQLEPAQLRATQALASTLAQGVRTSRLDAGGIDLLTQEFSLDSREGVALMCLAEAMLRVPDTETRNKLIRDKIVDQDWRSHAGNSPSLFVNATAWGLFVTGKLLKKPDEEALAAALSNVLRKGGEGVVRAGVAYAMRLLGKQFVTGQTIEEAIAAARVHEKQGYRYTYDMLGEGALTPADADAYYEAYLHAIEETGKAAKGQGPILGPGVSVKLTGLHPRYEVGQHARVIEEMYPRLLKLACAARRHDIGFHLDQEEAARFPLTLEMLQRLAHAPELQGWEGLGISMQAYQKRGRAVADWLIELGRSTKRRIFVRLVKGAYWDTEIKRCQAEGTANYPVFTRKVHSDVSYLACAKALLAAQDAIFPQFATHNAFSIAAVHTLAAGKEYEFQCLHGMGESVYDQIVGPAKLDRPCRVYAPVGPHATLLAYLVRRLLENGANTSFVNQVVDTDVRIEDIVADPVAVAARTQGQPNPGIPLPPNLPAWRRGSAVVSLADRPALQAELLRLAEGGPTVQPLYAWAVPAAAAAQAVPVLNPAARQERIGSYGASSVADVAEVLRAAAQGHEAWGQQPLPRRLQVLSAVAQALEAAAPRLGALLVAECGRTASEAAEEIRRATDLCRLCASQAGADASLAAAKPLGTVAVLASSSAPLYGLAGPVAAALVAGNAVVVKPSAHASLVAHEAVRLFLAAGVPPAALQLLLGEGATVGAALVRDPRVAAVLFNGSARVAGDIRELLAGLPQPPALLAGTGGFNAMVVDSSALPEQVISDAIFGASECAGQKGASLKLLCVQDSVADKIIGMLGAMLLERTVGDPRQVDTDIGPVATPAIRDQAEAYIARMQAKGLRVLRTRRHSGATQGLYVPPAIVDVGDLQALGHIDQGVRGPILHVLRWKAHELEALLAQLNAQTDLATLGLHTRINETTGQVLTQSAAEAIYVNRALHTARVGMQVEGGVGRAGQGPGLSGPLFLSRLVQPGPVPAQSAQGPFAPRRGTAGAKFFEYPVARDGQLLDRALHQRQEGERRAALLRRLASSAAAARGAAQGRQQSLQDALLAVVEQCKARGLPSLSGEENMLEYLPRGAVLCVGPAAGDFVCQAMTAVAVGAPVMLPRTPETAVIAQALGAGQCTLFDPARESLGSPLRPAAVLFNGEGESAQALRSRVLGSGPLAPVDVVTAGADGRYDWTRLVRERMTAINVSAAGGSEALMLVGDGA